MWGESDSTIPFQSYGSSVRGPSTSYSAAQSAVSAALLASFFLPDFIASRLSTMLWCC